MDNHLAHRQDRPAPMTPGIGVAGQVICPLMSITHTVPCVKHGCALWVELTYAAGTEDERKVANCAYTWNPMLTAENTQAINRLTQAIKEGQKDASA